MVPKDYKMQKVSWQLKLNMTKLVKKLIFYGMFSNVVGLVFFYLSAPPDCFTWTKVVSNAGYSTMLGYGLFGTDILEAWTEKRWMFWMKRPVRSLIISLLVSGVYCSIVIFGINYLWLAYFEKTSFSVFMKTHSHVVWIEYVIYYFIAIGYYARSFFLEWRTELEQKERLKAEAISLRYEALKSQVNPHFLFNSLNVLTALIDKNVDDAKLFTSELARFYRDIIRLKNDELISLRDEMEILKRYFYLQRIRFGESFDAVLPTEFNPELRVIPLSLQLLAENIFKHNSITMEKKVLVEVDVSEYYVTMKNTFVAKRQFAESSGFGLKSLSDRLLYLTGQELKIEKNADSFSVSLPLINIKHEPINTRG